MLRTLQEEETMSPSASRSNLKFLLDENVKKRVGAFLRSRGFDAIEAPKGFANGKLAALSKSEKRVLVTNDADFADFTLYPKEKILSVVLLRIPQNKPESLLNSFSKLLGKKTGAEDFEGQLIVLKENGFGSSPIPSVRRLKPKSSATFVYFTEP